MKLKDIYKVAIEYGIKMDPRGEKAVKEQLQLEKKKYEVLKVEEKKYFDEEKLVNPYSDSRIIYDNGKEIKNVLVGVDMEVQEILLADRLNEKGIKIDAVIAHHPSGLGLAQLYEVMGMQADIFNKFGVPISVAEDLTFARAKEVNERFMPTNFYRTYDAARLLDIQIMNMHTLTDNCVTTYLQNKFNKKKPKRIADIIDLLLEEKEYNEYAKRGMPPVVLIGDKARKVNKIFVDMTGGTEGAKEIYKNLVNSGVDTVVGMHFSPEHKKIMQEAKINAVIAGHISSDILGLNIMLDEIERKLGKLNVFEASGFIRVKRKKK